MKNNILPSCFLVALFFLTGCSGIKVVTDYDKSVDFSRYKSFKIAEVDEGYVAISDLNRRRLVKAVKSTMESKGYNEATEADLEIHLHLAVDEKVDVETETNYYSAGYARYGRRFGYAYVYGDTDVTVREYKEGTLVIDLVDTDKNQMVWQSIGSGTLNENPKNREERIQAAIEKILAGFPPN